MTATNNPSFGPLRSFFWPVYLHELKKVLPMLLMFFFINFNYTVLRDTKDTLVVTGAGAEVIPFLKVYGVVPCAIIFMLIYAKLSNILSKERLFYTVITPFIAFFGLFALVLYPLRDYLHPNAFADTIQSYLPIGFSGLIACLRNWTYSMFYIMAELWGSAVLSLMFWGFANDITRVTESKRFYTLFTIGANIAMLVSGPLIKYFSQLNPHLSSGERWQISLNWLMGMVFLSGLVIMATYWWINRNVLTDPKFYNPLEEKKLKKEKPKMGVFESLAYLARSKYILCIALIVMAYGVSINLVEVTWKNQVKLAYPAPNDYSYFMGDFSTITGGVTILMLLIAGPVIRNLGWGFAAMVTPIVLLITSAGFFSFVVFRDSLTGFIAMMGSSPLMLAVWFGMAQNIMSKSSKYAFFDPTKEMSYIPLDQESKVKGKAAIDVVGARLGKSGGSLIQQVLIVFLGSVSAITPYVAVATIAIIAGWFVVVRLLNKQFVALTSEKTEVKEVSAAAEPAKLQETPEAAAS